MWINWLKYYINLIIRLIILIKYKNIILNAENNACNKSSLVSMTAITSETGDLWFINIRPKILM